MILYAVFGFDQYLLRVFGFGRFFVCSFLWNQCPTSNVSFEQGGDYFLQQSDIERLLTKILL